MTHNSNERLKCIRGAPGGPGIGLVVVPCICAGTYLDILQVSRDLRTEVNARQPVTTKVEKDPGFTDGLMDCVLHDRVMPNMVMHLDHIQQSKSDGSRKRLSQPDRCVLVAGGIEVAEIHTHKPSMNQDPPHDDGQRHPQLPTVSKRGKTQGNLRHSRKHSGFGRFLWRVFH